MVTEADVVETLSVIEIRGNINPWDFRQRTLAERNLVA